MSALKTRLRAALLAAALLAPTSLAAADMPPPAVLLALLRGTLSALNQANVTGNYSVLRDLAAPAFRDANSSAALADRFRMWRERKLDFAAVLLLDAQLSRAPTIGPDGALSLSGYFPTAPLRVGFEMVFQPVNGNWRVASIDADVIAANAALASADNGPETTGSIAGAARPIPAAFTAPAPVLPDLKPERVNIPTPPGDRPRG